MQTAKKATAKENTASVNNVNSETVTKNNINFENITAANEQVYENVNHLLEQVGQFGLNYIGFTSSFFSRSIKSSQTITDITSEFMDEIYTSGAGNLKDSLTCTSFSELADLAENTIKKQVESLTRYSSEVLSLYSLNFDKLLNNI